MLLNPRFKGQRLPRLLCGERDAMLTDSCAVIVPGGSVPRFLVLRGDAGSLIGGSRHCHA